MNRVITILLAFTCMFAVSCTKHDGDANPSNTLEGVYSGTFYRVVGIAGPKSHVRLTFHNGQYSGTTDSTNYPGICQGTFSVAGTDSVNFLNSCFWTANFDWTYILNGSYVFTQNGNQLTIKRGYPGFIYEADIYELQKNN